ncbi:MAG: hypothetical protein ACO3LT_01360 [Ilumatobacteraceae bacterium]|jgi:hypothetical protein
MRPIEHSTESNFHKAAQDKWLVDLFNKRDYRGLLEAALVLNTLHQMERTKTAWAIREAADNLAAQFGMDRDSA